MFKSLLRRAWFFYAMAPLGVLVSVILDISRRLRAEEELREANSKLAGSVRILEDRSHQLAVLGELSGDLQSCLSASEAYDIAARHCQALFKPQAGALFRLNDDRGLELAASWNEITIPNGPLGIQSCWALRRGQQYIVDSEQRALPCEHRAGGPLASCACPWSLREKPSEFFTSSEVRALHLARLNWSWLRPRRSKSRSAWVT